MRNLLLLFTSAAVVFAQPLTQGDRNRALSELHSTAKMFTDSVAGLTDAQWKFKPAPDRWSIAECAEHIALSEDLLRGMVQKIVRAPADPKSAPPEKKVADEQVLKVIADRSRKATAPESIQPASKFGAPVAIVAHFTESRNTTLEYVRTTQDELRARFLPHSSVGTIDTYQWLLLLAAHTDRHVQQIQEVKTSPNYPH